MSKSLARVRAALESAGIRADIREMSEETRTAAQAAAAAGCQLDQIVKSILFAAPHSGRIYLFLTAGGQQVSPERAEALAQEPLGRADADLVRKMNGFAIGGVAPLGHLTALPVFFDPTLMQFDLVWAAAGTPRHIFAIAPRDLLLVSGAVLAQFTAP